MKVNGLLLMEIHDAIISEELFEKAQSILKGRYHVPYQLTNGVRSALAGL
ncbi:hypothetical protein ACT7DN_00070 [Bacillus paranthracis]